MSVDIQRRRFTVDDYQQMGRVGILGPEDRVELIDGEIVSMTPIGPRHNAAVARANKLFVTAAGDTAIVLTQGSVRLNMRSEPEPDIAILRPRQDYYASRHAGPADILLLLEVAQASIDIDRDVKLKLYARSGVHEYWILDLNENVLTCYDEPDGETYLHVRHYQHGQSVAPLLLPDCMVAVDDLLGPPPVQSHTNGSDLS